MKRLAYLMVTAFGLIAAGPISKFDEKPPNGDYESARSLGDVERCLIDLSGWLAPNVYKQADRPDDVTLIWTSGGTLAGISAARADLHKTPRGTHIRYWHPSSKIEACAPK